MKTRTLGRSGLGLLAQRRWIVPIPGTTKLHRLDENLGAVDVRYPEHIWIWSVAVDNALYVRAYNGRKSRWHQAAVRQKSGRIIAAGMTKEVTFEPVEGSINDLVDDAYRKKYRGSPYLSPMIGGRARSATVKVMPRARDDWGGSGATTVARDPDLLIYQRKGTFARLRL